MKSDKSLSMVDYLALGGGSVASGVISRIIPVNNPLLGNAIPIVAGVLLTRAKDRNIRFLGMGMVARGVGNAASSMGIGEEMIAEELGADGDFLDEEMSDEMLAEQLAADLAELEDEDAAQGTI